MENIIENEFARLLNDVADAIENNRAKVYHYSMTHQDGDEQTRASTLRSVSVEIDGECFRFEVR
jgi:hypothetical protein